jgi:O-antigen/teichoic acid export membrane protein
LALSDARVVRGVAALYVAGLTTLGLNTVFLTVLTNVSTQSQVGLFSILNVLLISASTVAVLALPLVGSGAVATPPAVARFLSGAGSRKVYLTSAAACAAISVSVLAVSAYPPFSALFGGEPSSAVVAACADAMVYAFGQLGAYSMVGVGRATGAGKLILASSVARYVLGGAFLIGTGLGLAGVFVGFAVGDALLAVSANYAAFRFTDGPPSPPGAFAAVRNYMLSVFLAALVGLAVSQSDKLLAFLNLPLSQLAVYNVATVGASVASFVPNAVTNVIVPSLSSSAADREAKLSILRVYTRHVSLTAVPVGFVLAALSPFILRIFTDPYASGSPVMAVIALTISFTSVTSVYSSALLAGDRAPLFTVSNLVGLAGMVAVATLTVPSLGFFGIALGRSVMLVISFGLVSFFVWRAGMLVLDAGAYLRSLVASGFAASVVYLAMEGFTDLGLERAAIVGLSLAMVGAGGAVFIVSMKAMRAYTEEDMDFIDTLVPERMKFLSRLARRLL